MFRHLFVLLVTFLFAPAFVLAQKTAVPSPESILGFHPTTDKTIADWVQINNYFQRLDAASDRVTVQTIGETTLKKPFIVAFISAPENLKNLERYKQIQARLADPRLVKNESERANLITQGKAVVAISCSIHSTEIVASQMSMNLAYELATARDAETLEILNNTILLLIPSMNPDGIQIVADWYRKTLNTSAEGSTPPELYHFYAGHDNNRDWFMLNLKETRLVTDLFWKNWYPQIVYDVHQMGTSGARFIIPPFFDPPNPNIPPLILREVGTIGYRMAADLQAENISGVATNAYFDTWWHGGFRSTPYYHNSIGILSEAASARLMSPITVTEAELRKEQKRRGLDSPLEVATNHPHPWTGGVWTPQDIARIEMISSRAVLKMGAKFRQEYLENFYNLNHQNLQPNAKQPVAYVIDAAQANEESVSRLIEILLAQGVEVHELIRELHTDETEIPAGSFVVFLAQPQRNNVQALFERQVYPNRVNANGEAEPPYDVAGWTLPLQMGVKTTAVQIFKDAAPQSAARKINDLNQARRVLNLSAAKEPFAKLPNPLNKNVRIGLYKSYNASMDEGWTRFVFDSFQIPFNSIFDAEVRRGDLNARFDAIVLPSQSENQIVSGLRKGEYPDEFAGGITEAGVENLRKFVEAGGTLICFDDSCEMAINRFKLPLKNVLSGLRRNEFYNPGSIVGLEVDTTNPLAKGLRRETPAYFINSAAFEATDNSKVKVAARYAAKNALMSGWMIGEKYLNGKIALAEIEMGRGKIVLFGFRPQHRGQTWATFPFVFNALTH
ncbi:MAG: M14 family metallopeptidase [Acidobacteriota bacterium]|nr:M14 family metallopeptidase [Acidobacteriota bacterium]